MELIINALKSIEPFKNTYFEIEDIYFNDLYKKCFLINVPSLKKRCKIRIPISQYPQTAQYEYRVLRFLEKFNIKWVPHVYYYGKGIDNLGEILIYEYIDGTSLDKFRCLSDDDAKIVVFQLERIISELHAITSKVCGEIEGKTYISWHDYMSDKFINHLRKALENKLLSYSEYEKIQKKFLINNEYYKQVKNSLLHYDIKPANIIYNPIIQKVTLIDFELTRFGDINSEFSRAFVLSEKFMNIQNQVIIPLLKSVYRKDYNDFITSDIFYLYSLYHLIALYNFLSTDHTYEVIPYVKRIKSLISEI